MYLHNERHTMYQSTELIYPVKAMDLAIPSFNAAPQPLYGSVCIHVSFRYLRMLVVKVSTMMGKGLAGPVLVSP